MCESTQSVRGLATGRLLALADGSFAIAMNSMIPGSPDRQRKSK